MIHGTIQPKLIDEYSVDKVTIQVSRKQFCRPEAQPILSS